MGLSTQAFVQTWGLAQRYFRYEVDGLDDLLNSGPSLIIAYHGRPVAYDVCMLAVEVYRRAGYMPHGIIHRAATQLPVLKHMCEDLGFVPGDGPELKEAIDKGEHILLLPGGNREAFRPGWVRYKIDWGRRTGYLRLALKYGIPLRPVVATGIDDVYWGLNNGEKLGKKLHVPLALPLWFGVGMGGMWPLAAPFPVKVRQKVGKPIHLPPTLAPTDREGLLTQHEAVCGQLQSMLDTLRKETIS